MDYAVIKSGGKQYRVSKGDILELDKLNRNEKETISFEEVLLAVNEGKISIGKPNIAGAKVEGKLIENKKGDKIRVMKFKAKSRYRRAIGFRAQLSVVEIEKIDFGGEKTVKSAPKTAKK